MRNMVKLGFIATVLSLISCSNDFLPAPEMKFCMLDDGKCVFINAQEGFPESTCEKLSGRIIPDSTIVDVPDVCKKVN